MNQISIGYLTWKKHDIFARTLKSHQDNGLYNVIPPENRSVFIQEYSTKEIELAEKYHINVLKDKKNIGILDAFVQLAENCKTKYFIFSENDFLLMKDGFDVQKTMNDVISILDNDKYGVVKLSNSKKPGFLYVKGGEGWLKGDQSKYQYKAESLSWIPNPKEFYKGIKTVLHNYEWFVFDKEDQRWSNHIYACNTEYLQKVIVPILKHNRDNNPKLDRKYQGLEDTLINAGGIPKQTDVIKELIALHNKRKFYSGGGNFFHNRR